MILRVYSRPSCHLCVEAKEKVERVARRYGLLVEVVDIDGSSDLLERFQRRIPVVELDGEELGWGRISEKGLSHAIEKRTKPADDPPR